MTVNFILYLLDLLDRFATEHAVILMNHHYELDWLYGWMVGDRSGVLGNCRLVIFWLYPFSIHELSLL